MLDKALNCLKHQEIVGLMQSNTVGLGWVTVPKRRSKGYQKGEERACYLYKVDGGKAHNYGVSQQPHGKWSTWESITNRTITDTDIWKISQASLQPGQSASSNTRHWKEQNQLVSSN